jgi:hypothetical protein
MAPSFFETACGPWGPDDVSRQKKCLLVTLALVNAAMTAEQLLVEFWTPADWPPYSPNLISLDFSIWCVLQEKGQATPHTNLTAIRLSITVEWDWLVTEYIHKNYCSFRCHR